jgi:hypothetical protein
VILGRTSLLLLLWGYVATSRYYIVANLQIGDLIAIAVLMVVLLSPVSLRALLDFLAGPYAWLAGTAVIVVLSISLVHWSPLDDLAFAAQFAFTVWVVVPLLALSVAHTPNPLKSLEQSTWVFLIWYTIGATLLFGFQRDWILYMTGIGRVFSHYVFLVFAHVGACLAIVQLSRQARPTWRYLALLGLSAVPTLLAASRTGLVALAAVGAIGILASVRSVRGLAVGVVASTLLILVLTSTRIQQFLGVRVLSASGMFEDAQRVRAIARTMEKVADRPDALIWGLGWGNSGDGLVVHNLFIQVAAEGGILTCLLLSALLALPWAWSLRRRDEHPAHRYLASLLALMVWLTWLLNAFVIERVYWLTYGLALGLAYGARRAAEASVRARLLASALPALALRDRR